MLLRTLHTIRLKRMGAEPWTLPQTPHTRKQAFHQTRSILSGFVLCVKLGWVGGTLLWRGGQGSWLIPSFWHKKETKKPLLKSWVNGAEQVSLNSYTEEQEMGLERVTSTGHAITKGRPLFSSRIQVDTSLEDLLQSLGQIHHLVLESKPPAHSSSLLPTCMESSPQSSISRMKTTVAELFINIVAAGQHLEIVVIRTLNYVLVATQVHRLQVFHMHTTTQQVKETVYSRAAQAQTLSKSKKLKYSKLTFKAQSIVIRSHS